MGDRNRAIAWRAIDSTALHARRQGAAATAAPHCVHQKTDHGHQDQEAKQAAATKEEGHYEGEAEAAAIAALVAATAITAAPAITPWHGSGAEAAAADATATGCLAGLRHRQQECEHQGWNHQAAEQPSHERGGT